SVLVSYCCSFTVFFLWIYYNVRPLFGHPWLHPFRPVFDLLLLRLRKEICHVDAVSPHRSASLIRSVSQAKQIAVSSDIGYAKAYSHTQSGPIEIRCLGLFFATSAF